MEKSLYLEYVQRFFPQLVLSIVERLNEKRANQLPYMYKTLLTPDFSADGRWSSILAEYNRVAADAERGGQRELGMQAPTLRRTMVAP